ncbi:MAG TPA: hypothetical protein VFW90_03785, partial [Candidatus Saccharimonadales bacterium]|nr:hypothetical protein [Candidatus Saccharimonadales bacterium]
MRKNKIIDRGLLSFIAIIMMLAPSLLTAFLRPNLALAKQLSNRSVSIGSSKAGATDVVYTVSFDVGQDTTPLKGIVVQFCDSSSGPLIGNPCTGPTGFTLTPASLSVPAASQTIGGVAVTNAYAVDTTHSNANTLILTNSTGNAATAGQTVSFVLGTGAGDGVANPSTVGTFYARLLTYSDDSAASGYATNGQTPGAYLDDGGIALSTANQLTTTARVQEHLTFCVGTTTVNDYNTVVSDKCADAFTGSCGTSVDLGILDSTAISTSPVQTAAGTPGFGNGCTGAAMVQTNAVHGVVISYFAEPDQGSGRLKVPGASCAGTQPDNTDQCFNNNADGAP